MRDVNRLPPLAAELRAALRRLARAPGFAAACVLALAAGIGVAAAAFGVLKAAVLDALPFVDASQVVEVGARNPQQGANGGITVAEAQDFAAGVPGLAAIGYYTWGGETFTAVGGRPRELTVLRVSAQFGAAIGTRPLLGRALDVDDAAQGRRVALLSHREWQRGFGGDAGVVGRVLPTADGPLEIVGVMPPGFEYPSPDVGLWMPLARANEPGPDAPVWINARFLTAVARLAPGAERSTVEAALAQRALALTDSRGLPDRGWRPALTPIAEVVLGDQATVLWGCFAIALLVLAIAGINTGILMHARVVARRREHAVAQALGASRARVLRGIVFELAVLALAGLLSGLALARLSLGAWSTALQDALPRGAPDVDGGVVAVACAFAFGVVALAALLGARAPADPAEALRGGRGTLPRGGRALRAGPALATAMSTVAVVSAAAIGLSVLSLSRIDPGWRDDGVFAVQLFRDGDAAEWRRFVPAALEQLRAQPGIASATATTAAPLSVIGSWNIDLALPGRAEPEPYQVLLRRVDDAYLPLLDIPLRRGRGFAAGDRAGGAPVAIVNEALVRASFPGVDPLGQRIALPVGDGPRVAFEIVGVMADIRNGGPRSAARPEVLLPFDQSPWQGITLLARSRLPREQALAAIERAVWAVAPGEGVTRRFALADDRAARTALVSLLGQVLAVFAACALLLAGFGVYALAAFVQRQRLPEYGLRLALGARPAALARGVLGGVLRSALPGVVLGALGAAGAVALLETQLYGLGAMWPLAWGAALAATGLAALFAGWLPARRAAAVDPAQTLRGD
jgi:predicted permease